MKYLSDLDVERQQESYSLVRIITWATPMLGFLGTVIGIAQALGGINGEQLSSSFINAVDGMTAGLFVAFDTTALALSLTIALMFLQFMIERLERQLLVSVDSRVGELLVGRFEEVGSGNDPHVKAIQRLGQSVIESSEKLVQRQSDIWQQSLGAAEQRWSSLADSTGGQLQSALSNAIDGSLERHAEHMAGIEREAAEQLRQRWEQWQVALSENARLLHAQQKELARHGEIMLKVVQATGDVIGLEKSLNENLKSLAGAKNFEDTVMSLSAAIHLLNARLGHVSDPARQVELDTSGTQDRAA